MNPTSQIEAFYIKYFLKQFPEPCENCKIAHFDNLKKKTRSKVFLRIYFSGKAVERIDVSSILRKHQNLLPEKLTYREPPTVLYKRTKTIGSDIFNYKKTIDEVLTKDWQDGNNHSCSCHLSKFTDPHHKHIVTGDLRIVTDRILRSLMSKGPIFREPRNVNWTNLSCNIRQTLESCIKEWAQLEKIDKCWFDEWFDKVWEDVLDRIAVVSKATNRRRPTHVSSAKGKEALSRFDAKYVIVPTDKAGNNFFIVCRKFNIKQSMRELGIFLKSKSSNPTYELIDMDITSITNRHKQYIKKKLGFKPDSIPDKLPFIYWIPKMHKKPFSKQRYIAASAN